MEVIKMNTLFTKNFNQSNFYKKLMISKNTFYILFSFLYAIFFFILLFFIIIKCDIQTDIINHSYFVYLRAINQGEHSNFVFYYLARIFSLFSKNYQNILIGTIALVAFASGIKSYLTLKYIDNRNERVSFIILMGIATLFYYPYFALPPLNHNFFKGLIRPNIYHNSTMLVVMPLVIYLYNMIIKAIECKFIKFNFVYFTICSFCISFIKISFLFVLVPALSLYLFHFLIINKEINYRLLFVIFIPSIFILFVYSQVFLFGANYKVSGYDSKVILSPFKFWNLETNNLLISLLHSLAYPIAVLILNFKKVINNSSLKFSLILFSIALVISILFCESGKLILHGNLTWQLHICTYLLLIELIKFHIENFKNINKYVNYFLILLLIGHFLMGIKYIIWIFEMNAYM